MDLCLSCKGCKSECPSNVDVARLKAEWQQHYYDTHGVPWRARLIAGFTRSMRLASRAPALYNWAVTNPVISSESRRSPALPPRRSLPTLHATTLASWHKRHANPSWQNYPNGRVHLFCDEFTNYNDTQVGIAAVELLNRLGYEVVVPRHVESGRAQLSKGLIREAQTLATRNVELLHGIITDSEPLIGLEPSAILGFRDEFPDLVPPQLKGPARQLALRALLFDEFIAREALAGKVSREAFTTEKRLIQITWALPSKGSCLSTSYHSDAGTAGKLSGFSHSFRLLRNGRLVRL